MLRKDHTILAACFCLVLAVFATYSNTLENPFVFDDVPSIEENPHIESLLPLSKSLGAPPGSGSSGRPLVSLSLALNYALGGRDVLGYHLVNITLLALGALALFRLSRRGLGLLFPDSGLGPAFTIALLWCLHPLHTDTLNHVIYRNGAMMGLFYLLSLDCALGAFQSERAGWASVGCVLAAACAMASKEVAVSLPLAALALDRQVGAGTIRGALRQRWGLYLGLAGTWGLLVLFVMTGDRGPSVGFGHTEVIGAMDSLRTQTLGIVHYLKVAALAEPQVFDHHGLQVVRDWSSVYFEAALLGLGLLVSLVGSLKRSVFGLLGLAFYAILAPTSSFIPLAGELIGEHRMYLPLAPLIALGVLAFARLGVGVFSRYRMLAPVLVTGLALVLAQSSHSRNRVYASRATLWQDTVEKRPRNERAWNHLAIALKNEGRGAEAEVAFLRTLELSPRNGKVSFNYGNLLFARGDLDGALERYAAAARFRPKDEVIRFNLGYLLREMGQVAEGQGEYRAAIALKPDFERALRLLAWSLATESNPNLRDGQEALELARRLNQLTGGDHPRHLDVLAAALAETGDHMEAAKVAERAQRAAERAGQTRLAAKIRGRRDLYRQGQPFREAQ